MQKLSSTTMLKRAQKQISHLTASSKSPLLVRKQQSLLTNLINRSLSTPPPTVNTPSAEINTPIGAEQQLQQQQQLQQEQKLSELERTIQKYKNKNSRKNSFLLLFVTLLLLLLLNQGSNNEKNRKYVQSLLSQIFPIDGLSPIGSSSELNDDLSQLIVQYAIEHGLVGGQCCVIRDDETVYHKSFGYSDLENHIPMQNEARIRLFESFLVNIAEQLSQQQQVDMNSAKALQVIRSMLDNEMKDTCLDNQVELIKNRSRLYNRQNNGQLANAQVDENNKNYLTTAFDLCQFGNALLAAHSLLNDVTVDLSSSTGSSFLKPVVTSIPVAEEPAPSTTLPVLDVVSAPVLNQPVVIDTDVAIESSAIPAATETVAPTTEAVEHALVELKTEPSSTESRGDELAVEQIEPIANPVAEMFANSEPAFENELSNEQVSVDIEHTPTQESLSAEAVAIPSNQEDVIDDVSNVQQEQPAEQAESSAVDVVVVQPSSDEVSLENQEEIITSVSGTSRGNGFTADRISLAHRKKPVRVVVNTDGAVGSSSVLFLIPEERIAVSILTNTESAKLQPLAELIARETIAYLDRDKIYD